MTTTALVMMILAMVTVWGGLAAALTWAATHPEKPE